MQKKSLNLLTKEYVGKLIVLCSIPFIAALVVWLSPLSFVPVPWPDDSAFYFVAKEFFKWPPRWVMLPQAPFEPTYRIFNFNTMPLYPLIIGIGRWLGIDGSFALKIWPLGAWAASGALLVGILFRAGLPATMCIILALAVSLDPVLRWASVLIRPESLIGLCGVAMVLGLSLGFPKRFQAKKLWDPVAALLAIAAYAHFNSIHLIFPVVAVMARSPRALIKTGLRTALYLVPWLLMIASHPTLFLHQIKLQWGRLAVGNDWLHSPEKALSSLFQDMGSPDSWPAVIKWAALGLWALIFLAIASGVVFPLFASFKKERSEINRISLVPSAAWIIGATWLWHTKPEVWFIYYLHLSIWVFSGLVGLFFWKQTRISLENTAQSFMALIVLGCLVLPITLIFAYTDVRQLIRLTGSQSWRWSTYYGFVDCIDSRLTRLEKNLGTPRPFKVWGPTFPDVTVELSRRHPDWEFTRTNDFHNRAALAIRHGWDAEAVVVTETLGWTERSVSAPLDEYPQIQSAWMTWPAYFLNQLWKAPGWKPNRYLCQRERWQAFMFMKNE